MTKNLEGNMPPINTPLQQTDAFELKPSEKQQMQEKPSASTDKPKSRL